MSVKNILRILSYVSFFILLTLYQAFAQNEDNIWMMGYTSFSSTNPDPDSLMGGILFDFNYDPVKIYREENNYVSFKEEMTSMCDSAGNILFFSNGMQIYDRNYCVMEGGDTIAYGEFWERFVRKHSTYNYDILSGFRIWQGALSLPYPGRNDKYIMLYQDFDIQNKHINHVYYAVIDMSANSGLGKVLKKDIDLIDQNENTLWVSGWGKMTACQHANGRDWWIALPNSIENKVLLYLLSPKGLELNKEVAFETNKVSKPSLGQASFSPHGLRYAIWGGDSILGPGYFRVFDFDRCSGELSNERSDTLLSIYGDGLCFSPNGNYIYISNDQNIFQFDLNSNSLFESKEIVATWDQWENDFGISYTLSFMALGQDNKIYVIPNGASSEYLHRINKPDNQGHYCDVQQHIIKLPTTVGTSATIPNYPNFRLGPIDGSNCDSLSINNIPKSKFSYEQDTLNPLSVHFTNLSYYEPEDFFWDFGDGSFSSENNPNHLFAEMGVYNVCLTVSNDYGSDSSSHSLCIGSVNSNELNNNDIEIYIFPNPVDDILLVTIDNYLPVSAYFELYSFDGRIVLERDLRYGWNSINLNNLENGIYIYIVIDQQHELKKGKLIISKK